MSKREAIRKAIIEWHDARASRGACVADSEGLLCCISAPEDAYEAARHKAGLDEVLDIIERLS